MVKIIVHEDEEQTSAEVQSARQAACDTCDSYDASLDACNECGCLVARKKLYVDDTCPLGRWA